MSQYKKQHFNEDCLKKIRVSRDHQLTKHCQLTKKKKFNIISAECSTKVVQRLNRSHVNTQHFNSYSSSRTNTKKKCIFVHFLYLCLTDLSKENVVLFVCTQLAGHLHTGHYPQHCFPMGIVLLTCFPTTVSFLLFFPGRCPLTPLTNPVFVFIALPSLTCTNYPMWWRY